jgi:hypothetical protein
MNCIIALNLAGFGIPSLSVVQADEGSVELCWDKIWWPANQVWEDCAVEVHQVALGPEDIAAEVSRGTWARGNCCPFCM